MPTNPDPREERPKPPFPDQQQSPPGTIKRLYPSADHGESSYMGADRLLGQVAIITGADSGIGRATAIALAKEGANVVLSYLPEKRRMRSRFLSRFMKREGRQCAFTEISVRWIRRRWQNTAVGIIRTLH